MNVFLNTFFDEKNKNFLNEQIFHNSLTIKMFGFFFRGDKLNNCRAIHTTVYSVRHSNRCTAAVLSHLLRAHHLYTVEERGLMKLGKKKKSIKLNLNKSH